MEFQIDTAFLHCYLYLKESFCTDLCEGGMSILHYNHPEDAGIPPLSLRSAPASWWDGSKAIPVGILIDIWGRSSNCHRSDLITFSPQFTMVFFDHLEPSYWAIFFSLPIGLLNKVTDPACFYCFPNSFRCTLVIAGDTHLITLWGNCNWRGSHLEGTT